MLIGNPFVGNTDKKLSKEELVQALRVDIAGELEAILTYDAHAMATDDQRAKAILYSIRDEERQHVGELLHLMEILDPQEAQLIAKGKQEVDQLLNQKGLLMAGGQAQPGGNQVQPGGGQAQPGGGQAQPGQMGQFPYIQGLQGAVEQEQAIRNQIQDQYGAGAQQEAEGPGAGHKLGMPYPPYPGNLGHRGPNNWK